MSYPFRAGGLRRSAPAAALMVLAGLVVAGCSPSPEDEARTYVQTIAADRAAKDAQFASDAGSPVPVEKRKQFLPLNYFAIDPDYSVPAALEQSADRPTFPMPTSTGQTRQMQRVGILEFTLKGKPLSLGAFVEEGQPLNLLFVPFTDLTTGTETYAAGRYLEIAVTPTGLYLIDFNRAFHPYCYYNESYDCPYPPSSNRLQVPIRAGERLARVAATTGLPPASPGAAR